MTVLHHDFESRSLVDLSVRGLHNYCTDPSTKVLMCSWAIDSGKVNLWQPHLEEIPAEFKDAVADPHVVKVAWNSEFERNIWKYVLRTWIPYEQWFDPMIQARMLSMPGYLEEVSQILGLKDDAKMPWGTKKDPGEAQKLIKLFCEPQYKGGEETLFGISEPWFADWNSNPEEWTRFGEYCKQDLIAERGIMRKMYKFPIPDIEMQGWFLDQKINDRGMPTKLVLIQSAAKIAERAKAELRAKTKEISGAENPNSNPQIMAWLKTQGYTFGSIGKAFVARALNGECNLTEAARTLLDIRKDVAKTSDAKLEAIANAISDDGRLRHQFSFLGSARAGRWCLAEGTNIAVKTADGLLIQKPIQDVVITDLVWDGDNWVSHGGVVFSGDKEVITWDGITATSEHEVWTSSTKKKSLYEARNNNQLLWPGPPLYIIYKITSPSNKSYIGLTKTSLKTRWGQHKKKALDTSVNHPFYNAIRKYGGDAFTIAEIDWASSRTAAQNLEKFHIAVHDKTLLYNLSPGGEADGETGSRIFWTRINSDPVAKKVYREKLSTCQKLRGRKAWAALAKGSEQWRKNNPREVWRIAYRASRIAKRRAGNIPKSNDRPLKEKLLWKYKRGVKTRENALRQWKTRTDSQEVAKKISQSSKNNWAKIIDPVHRAAKTAQARAAIDRVKQGRAASQGLKKFWQELKSNPEQYATYMAARTASLMKTLGAS